ncbi:MAG: sigma-E factor negative regulatory protein [Woeseiaceae bacterium]|nr:sigma-E factor negative regulatory protein [Woeseiaceae bacterium]
MNDQIKMQLSAFVDGELSDAESELLVRRISRDAELRDQIAEYQAIGRVMRGEYSVRLDGLLERVNANLEAETAVEPPAVSRQSALFRPLVGVASAAAVAMIALVGYGQISGGDTPVTTADQYTVPSAESADLLDYHARHGELATGLNNRLVTLQIREEALEDPVEDDPEEPEDETNDQEVTN